MTAQSAAEPPRLYPTFRYRDAPAMIDWLVETLGFSVRARYEENGVVHHAELSLGSSMIMLGSVRDNEYGRMVGEPGEQGGKSVYVAVDNADAAYARARATGATILKELADQDYGSRDFICADPEGNVWSVGTYWPKADDKP